MFGSDCSVEAKQNPSEAAIPFFLLLLNHNILHLVLHPEQRKNLKTQFRRICSPPPQHLNCSEEFRVALVKENIFREA